MSHIWKHHVAATRAQHPTMPFKEVLKTASVTYKRNTLHGKEQRPLALLSVTNELKNSKDAIDRHQKVVSRLQKDLTSSTEYGVFQNHMKNLDKTYFAMHSALDNYERSRKIAKMTKEVKIDILPDSKQLLLIDGPLKIHPETASALENFRHTDRLLIEALLDRRGLFVRLLLFKTVKAKEEHVRRNHTFPSSLEDDPDSFPGSIVQFYSSHAGSRHVSLVLEPLVMEMLHDGLPKTV